MNESLKKLASEAVNLHKKIKADTEKLQNIKTFNAFIQSFMALFAFLKHFLLYYRMVDEKYLSNHQTWFEYI